MRRVRALSARHTGGGDASRRHRLALAAAITGTLSISAALIAALGADEHWALDDRVRGWLQSRRSPRARALLRGAGSAGSVVVYGPATTLAATLVARRRGTRQAMPIVVAVAGAAAMSHLVKRAVRRPRPPSLARTPDEHPSFPSGHTTRASAAALTIAYALVRERIVSRGVALPVALAIVAAVGASRTLVDKHWTTDVIGGWALGSAASAGAALWYEAVRREMVT